MELILAPLAEITSKEFRHLCYQGGADCCYSEMVSAKAITLKNRRTRDIASVDKDEKKTFIQFFGSDPEVMKDAVSTVLEKETPAGIDINCGCPVKKVVGQGAGSALMDHPEKLGAIVRAVRSVTTLPLSVKIRKGFREPNYIKCALTAQENGADILIVHPRLRTELFMGISDFKVSFELAGILDIPVIHSGDIKRMEDVKQFSDNGIKGLMIGRGVLGKPWIFNNLKGKDVSVEEERKFMEQHFRCYINAVNLKWGHTMMRRHASWYSTGKKGSSEFRNGIFKPSKTMDETINEIETFFGIKI
jgi:tRNA-dihydrouridine synthase B